MSAYKVQGWRFSKFEKADIREVIGSHATELTEDDLEQLTMLNKPEDFDTYVVVARPQPTSSALKKTFQMVDDLLDHFLQINNFLLDRRVKYWHKMEAIMVPYKVVHRDMYKKANQLKFTSLFTKC